MFGETYNWLIDHCWSSETLRLGEIATDGAVFDRYTAVGISSRPIHELVGTRNKIGPTRADRYSIYRHHWFIQRPYAHVRHDER
jgi:hypothetical protein